jgi:hypothetical protein
MVDRKLSFIADRIIRELGITDYSDANIDIIYQNVLLSNREYQRRSAADVRSTISSLVKNFFAAQNASLDIFCCNIHI